MRALRGARGKGLLFLALTAFLVPLLCGCGSGSSGGKANPDVAEHAPAVKVTGNGFIVAIDADPNRGIRGMTISITLSVTNLSGSDKTFSLPTAQEYEFKAYNSAGKEVWRWSQGQMFAQAVTPVTIKSSGNLSFGTSWPTSGLPQGIYTLKGYFLGLPGLQPVDTVVLQ